MNEWPSLENSAFPMAAYIIVHHVRWAQPILIYPTRRDQIPYHGFRTDIYLLIVVYTHLTAYHNQIPEMLHHDYHQKAYDIDENGALPFYLLYNNKYPTTIQTI